MAKKDKDEHVHNKNGNRQQNETEIGREIVKTVEIYCTCGAWQATDVIGRRRKD